MNLESILPPLPIPVAHIWQHGETGNTGFLANGPAKDIEHWERMNRPRKVIGPLFSYDQMHAHALAAARAGAVAALDEAMNICDAHEDTHGADDITCGKINCAPICAGLIRRLRDTIMEGK